jgi:predicted NBD/HSP70 family sugar kinase
MGAEVRRDHRETWQSATCILRVMADRAALIETYKQGPAAVEAAVAGFSDADLDRRPSPGDWSAREVVHHLADAETRSAIRLRQLLAEDDAVIHGYDEVQYARVLHSDRPIGSSLALLRAVRSATAELLDRLTDADFARTGIHTESGAYGVEDWLRIYVDHCEDHARQIVDAAGR